MKQLALTVVFWLILLSTVEAATYWVRPTGTMSGCTASATAPSADSGYKATITAGLGCLSPGDTLYIRAGTYDAIITNVTAGTTSTPTLISNYQNETVTLKSTTCPNEIVGSGSRQYVTFHGLIVDGSLLADNTVNCQGVAITTNVIFENGEVRFLPRTGVFVLQAGGTIRNSWIHHNGNDIDPAAPDHGIYVSGGNPAQNTLIEGNTINNNSSLGIHAHASGCVGCMDNLIIKNNTVSHNGVGNARTGDQVVKRFGGGILIDDGSNQKVYNNVIYDEGSSLSFNAGIWLWDSNTINAVVSNNTVYNSSYGIAQQAGSATFQNNILWQITSGGGITFNGGSRTNDHNLCTSGCTGTGSINGSNPLFANTTTHDFHIPLGSPAHDVGANIATSLGCISGSTCTDFAGVVRPQGGSWDMGAYEFAAVGTPVVTITKPGLCVGTASACTISGSANNILTLTGTSTQSGGSVSWACDRCGSGTASGTTSWTTSTITLLSGVNIIDVTGIDSALNTATARIIVTFVPTFSGNSPVLLFGLETGSGTTATDSSGNGNNGTLVNGPTWITNGRFGNAVRFNGINNYISITDSNSLRLTQSFTISAYVQPTSSFTTFKAIAHKNTGGTLGSPYELYATVTGNCASGGVSGFVTVNGASGPTYAACNTTPLQTGVWTHVAVTYNGTQVCLYKDANDATKVCTPASGYMEPSTVAAPTTLQIGGSEFGEYFQGLIDEVRIYNYAIPLTAASNTTPGLPSCSPANFADNTTSPSIVGNMNCPIINLTPPSQFKLSAGATELKLGTSATAAKIGANP